MSESNGIGYFPIPNMNGEVAMPVLRTDIVKQINGRDGQPSSPLYCGNEHSIMQEIAPTFACFRKYWTEHSHLFPDAEKPKIIIEDDDLRTLHKVGAYNLRITNNTLFIEFDEDNEPRYPPSSSDESSDEEERVDKFVNVKESSRHLKGGQICFMKLIEPTFEQDGVVMYGYKGGTGKFSTIPFSKFDVVCFGDCLVVHDDTPITTLCVTEFAQTRKVFAKRHLRNVLKHYSEQEYERYIIGCKYSQASVDVEKILIWDCVQKLDTINYHKRTMLRWKILFTSLLNHWEDIRMGQMKVVVLYETVFLVDSSQYNKETFLSLRPGTRIFCGEMFILHKCSLHLPLCDELMAPTYSAIYQRGFKIPRISGTAVYLIADDVATIDQMLADIGEQQFLISVFVLSARLEDRERLFSHQHIVEVEIINNQSIASTLSGIFRRGTIRSMVVSSGYEVPTGETVLVIDSFKEQWTFGHYCPTVTILARNQFSLEAVLKMFDKTDIHMKLTTRVHVLLERLDNRGKVKDLLDLYISVHHSDSASVEQFSIRELPLARKLKSLDYPIDYFNLRRILPKTICMESSRHLIPYFTRSHVFTKVLKEGSKVLWMLDDSPIVTLIVESWEELDNLAAAFRPPHPRERPQAKVAVVTSLPETDYDKIKDYICRLTRVHLNSVGVAFFKPTERLENHFASLGYEMMPMNRIHTLLVLGSEAMVPEELSLLNTDMTSLSNFKLDLFVDLRVEPERITVIGSEEECEEARQHIENHEVYSKAKDVHYFTYNRIWKMTYKDQLKKKEYVLE